MEWVKSHSNPGKDLPWGGGIGKTHTHTHTHGCTHHGGRMQNCVCVFN